MAAAPLSPLPPQYDPFVVEAKWQERWEAAAAFRADPQAPGPTYCIVIPPPNVTGSLHMGHAFNMSLIDTLTRYHRMQGYNTLCLPGTDHASIAVQTLVEKDLKTKDGKTRADIGREAFLERAWTWRADYGGQIVGQFRQLGVSLDWSRERFTMDEMLSKAVLEAFVRLYEQGLIYRGNYLVNWCPASQSAVSDLELEAKEVQGHLWYFRYPLSDGSGSLVVATTRPETMLGDTGVAVNPNDERYRALIGQTLTLPLVGRRIPIVADELVDPTFGTGCVKVTPAHDPNDFEMGKRHRLPFITVMNKDGTMNEQAGEFQGLDRFAARKAVVGALEAQGFLDKIEPYTHTVPHSDRGGVPVEPLLSTQWFVKIDGLAATAREALDRMEPTFVPERWTKVYRDWLGNLRDWCISRQLWWGHQIPAWYAVSETDGAIADQTPFVVARSETEAIAAAQAQFGPDVVLERDPDVLDTWFSSGLWPFSTLGWPEATADLQRYYPTSTLVTGFDIIFFWVARMTMMAGYFTGQMPFQDVYIHGLVRDETGQKMSKSKGNVVDPRLLMDCYGTDAMRYTLIRDVAGAGQDISLQLNRAVYELKLLQKKWPVLAETATSDGELVEQLLQSLPLPQQSALVRELKKALPKQSPEALMGEVAQALGRMAAGQEAAKTPAAKAIADLQATSLSDSVEAARNFTNKLWNASRFVMMNLDGLTPAQLGEPSITAADALADRWILSRFHRTVEQTCASIEQYGLGEAVKGLYEFIWGDFCDWYIELVKTRLQDKTPEGSASRLTAQRILAYVLDGILRLIHPFMPHISEEIWHSLSHQDESVFLALQSYPALQAAWIDPGLEKDFELLIGVIRVARNLRAEVGVKPGAKVPLLLLSEDPDERNLLAIATTPLQDLAKAETVTLLTPDAPTPQKSFVGVVGTVQVLLPLEGLVDLDALNVKLQKNLTKVAAEIQSLSTRLSNPGFVNKAPEDVIAIARASLAEAQEQAKILQSRIERL